jgi:hypothetical protein
MTDLFEHLPDGGEEIRRNVQANGDRQLDLSEAQQALQLDCGTATIARRGWRGGFIAGSILPGYPCEALNFCTLLPQLLRDLSGPLLGILPLRSA